MLALRAAIRCNATTKTTITRNTFNSIKYLQVSSSASTRIPQEAIQTNTWTTYLKPQPSFLNGYLLHRRHFATNITNKDEDSNALQRVYYGSLASRMKAVKFFSLTTSFAGIAAQPILMEQGMKLGGTGMAVVLCSFAGFFTFVTPFLLHFITKKYVTEIHYNPKTDEYLATTISLFLRKIQTKFHPSDVKVPEVPGMFTSFLVGDKPLFVDPALFDDPEHYVRIMGYDKPIDFKLDLSKAGSDTSNDVKSK